MKKFLSLLAIVIGFIFSVAIDKVQLGICFSSLFVIWLFWITWPFWQYIEGKKEKIAALKRLTVDEMTGIEYERYCGSKIMETGKVRKIDYTPASNDYGADIILYMKDGAKLVAQCKRYSGRVGNSAVQEIVAAKAHYNADGAIIMTNSFLTENARTLAQENGVLVYESFK